MPMSRPENDERMVLIYDSQIVTLLEAFGEVASTRPSAST